MQPINDMEGKNTMDYHSGAYNAEDNSHTQVREQIRVDEDASVSNQNDVLPLTQGETVDGDHDDRQDSCDGQSGIYEDGKPKKHSALEIGSDQPVSEHTTGAIGHDEDSRSQSRPNGDENEAEDKEDNNLIIEEEVESTSRNSLSFGTDLPLLTQPEQELSNQGGSVCTKSSHCNTDERDSYCLTTDASVPDKASEQENNDIETPQRTIAPDTLTCIDNENTTSTSYNSPRPAGATVPAPLDDDKINETEKNGPIDRVPRVRFDSNLTQNSASFHSDGNDSSDEKAMKAIISSDVSDSKLPVLKDEDVTGPSVEDSFFPLMQPSNEASDDEEEEDISDSDSGDSSVSSDDSTLTDFNSSASPESRQKTPEINRIRRKKMLRNEAFLKEHGLLNGIGNTITSNGIANQKNSISTTQDEKIERKMSYLESPSTPSSVSGTQKRGMIFRTPYNSVVPVPVASCINDAQEKQEQQPPLLDPIHQMMSRYPHRHDQIRTLAGRLNGSVRQALLASQQLQEEQNEQYVHVPLPIFVTGPGGTGKTCIVRDVVYGVKERHPKAVIGVAYVNCASIEPRSIHTIVGQIFQQFMKSAQIQQTRSRKRKRTSYMTGKSQESKKQISDNGASNNLKDTMEAETNGSQKNALEKTRATTDGMGEQESNRANGGIYNIHPPVSTSIINGDEEEEDMIDPSEDALENNGNNEDLIESQRSRYSRVSISKLKKVAHQENKARKAGGDNNGEQGTIQASEILKSSVNPQTAVASFGRELVPYFGRVELELNQNRSAGCAFLVLDKGDWLLSFSSKTSAHNSFLAQLLLLPRMMNLNLTIIVVGSHTLLEQSRFNPHAPGTIKGALQPARIHFGAYRGKAVFNSILRQLHTRELIIGVHRGDSGSGGMNKLSEYCSVLFDSFIDIMVQSLQKVTRDVSELIRLGRLLWPVYIAPLSDSCFNESKAKAEKALPILNRRIMPMIGYVIKYCLFMPGMECPSSLSGASLEASSTAKSSSCRHDLSIQSKFLLLAAYICQKNRSDRDADLLTIQKKGNRKRKTKTSRPDNDNNVAYGSIATSQQQSRTGSDRMATFPLERMLSIFVKLVDLNRKVTRDSISENGHISRQYGATMGSTHFSESLAQLRDLGLIVETRMGIAALGENREVVDLVNMDASKYSCTLRKDEARRIADSIDVDLETYLMNDR